MTPEQWRYQVRPADTEPTFDVPVFYNDQPCIVWTLSIMHWLQDLGSPVEYSASHYAERRSLFFSFHWLQAFVVNNSSVVLIALQPLWQLLVLVHSFFPRLTLDSMPSWVQHQSRYLLQAPAKDNVVNFASHQSSSAAMVLICTSRSG